jgi:hypothetical protein
MSRDACRRLSLAVTMGVLIYSAGSWFFVPVHLVVGSVLQRVGIGPVIPPYPALVADRVVWWVQWGLAVVASLYVWLPCALVILVLHCPSDRPWNTASQRRAA